MVYLKKLGEFKISSTHIFCQKFAAVSVKKIATFFLSNLLNSRRH